VVFGSFGFGSGFLWAFKKTAEKKKNCYNRKKTGRVATGVNILIN